MLGLFERMGASWEMPESFSFGDTNPDCNRMMPFRSLDESGGDGMEMAGGGVGRMGDDGQSSNFNVGVLRGSR